MLDGKCELYRMAHKQGFLCVWYSEYPLHVSSILHVFCQLQQRLLTSKYTFMKVDLTLPDCHCHFRLWCSAVHFTLSYMGA